MEPDTIAGMEKGPFAAAVGGSLLALLGLVTCLILGALRKRKNRSRRVAKRLENMGFMSNLTGGGADEPTSYDVMLNEFMAEHEEDRRIPEADDIEVERDLDDILGGFSSAPPVVPIAEEDRTIDFIDI